MSERDLNREFEATKRRLADLVLGRLTGYVDHYDDVVKETKEGWPTFSQSMRIKALADNKRILVADDTGVNGKTFTAIASKIRLDKQKGKKHPTLVIAPNCGMINAWNSSEVNRYAGYINGNEQSVVTIRDYSDLSQINGDTDFAVVNWEKLSVSQNDRRWQTTMEAINRLQPEFFVLDECHNGKGSGSLRSRNIMELTKQTVDKHVMLLSATPIPNRYKDLGMIFHLLDPVKYHSPGMFYQAAPEIMRELLHRQVWFRLTREQLKDELGLPDFHEREVKVPLSDKESEVYFKAWADCVSLGEGLTELRKALYDPNLSKYAGGEFIPGSKLKKLEEIVARHTADGAKVIVKTNYVNHGVIDGITQAVGKGRNVLTVDGSTDLDDRRKSYLLFRNDPDHNVLVSSRVTNESVDLTTGDVPCVLISVEPEMSPGEFIQFTGRAYRRGQRAPVTHESLVAESEYLNSLMVGHLNELATQYQVKVPRKFIPRTVDRDMISMRKAKAHIIEKIYDGEKLTTGEIALHDADELHAAAATLQSLGTAPKSFKEAAPFRQATIAQARWRNLGERQFGELVETRGWKKWKSLYEDGWEGSASQATLQDVGRLVDDLEAKALEPLRVYDVGAGAAYFSRATGRAVTCVDIDGDFLERGRKICEKKGIQNEYVTSTATHTPLKSGSADVVVNSYMIFYLGQDQNRTEVEECVLETNRLLEKGGNFIVTFPYTIEERALERFSKGLEKYGFEKRQYVGRKESKRNEMKNGCHILKYEKVRDCSEKQNVDLSFYDDRRKIIA